MGKIKKHLAYVTVVVKEYDEAIAFYTEKLGFELTENTELEHGKRWVVVTPPGSECSLVLGKAANDIQRSTIGNQAGGRVFLFLHTEDFWSDYDAMQTKGILFKEEPREEVYGTVVVFEDLYGNLWDLLQLK